MPVMIRHSSDRFLKIANAIMKKDQSTRQRKPAKPVVDVGGKGAMGQSMTGAVK